MATTLCPPCNINLHDQCWWFNGDETADGPCECTCHADHVRFGGGTESGTGYGFEGRGTGLIEEDDDEGMHANGERAQSVRPIETVKKSATESVEDGRGWRFRKPKQIATGTGRTMPEPTTAPCWCWRRHPLDDDACLECGWPKTHHHDNGYRSGEGNGRGSDDA